MFWFFLLFRNKYYYTDIFIFLCISLDWWKWVGVMHYVRRRTIKPSQNQEKHKRKSTKNEKSKTNKANLYGMCLCMLIVAILKPTQKCSQLSIFRPYYTFFERHAVQMKALHVLHLTRHYKLFDFEFFTRWSYNWIK